MVNFLLSRSQQTVAPAEIEKENWKLPDYRFGSYSVFLQAFLDQGYDFRFFPEINQTHGQIALRHDIDFDTNFALQSARIEAGLGIKATYFFLLRSNFYNIFSPEDYKNIEAIRELGHTVSIHFDPAIYEDFHKGLQTEVKLFREFFNLEVGIISLHRPNRFFQEFDAPIFGIEHTYQSKYFRDVKYFSDSTGVWRFGHPVNSAEFAQQKTLHVLIHPIWWMLEGQTNFDKLRAYYTQRVNALKSEFYNNCIPFRKINESV